MSGPCSMCQHFSTEGVAANMRSAGWGACREMRLRVGGFYMSQAAACGFSPTRFLAQPKVSEAVEERAAIIAEGCGVDQNEALERAKRLQPTPCDLPDEIDFG